MEGQQDVNGRYGVEQGTDGSWLLVDYGADGSKRVALERVLSEQEARLETNTLSQLESITSTFEPLEDDLENLLASTESLIDGGHNFNHLLRRSSPDSGEGSGRGKAPPER